jgi:hypothetical protein
MLLQFQFLSSPPVQSSKACFPTFNPDEHLDVHASTAEIQSWAPIVEKREEILNVSELRSMLGDK